MQNYIWYCWTQLQMLHWLKITAWVVFLICFIQNFPCFWVEGSYHSGTRGALGFSIVSLVNCSERLSQVNWFGWICFVLICTGKILFPQDMSLCACSFFVLLISSAVLTLSGLSNRLCSVRNESPPLVNSSPHSDSKQHDLNMIYDDSPVQI